jgi:DNA-binding GntR family transcriptional regulator
MITRRAIENLIKRWLLECRSTQGTFVRKPEVLRMVDKDFSLGLTQMLQSTGSQLRWYHCSLKQSFLPHWYMTYTKFKRGIQSKLIEGVRKWLLRLIAKHI